MRTRTVANQTCDFFDMEPSSTEVFAMSIAGPRSVAVG
jgi:hypothetical protein